MASLTIGQVAKRADVGVETVRFYERKGLLSEPNRKPSGYRQYDEEVIDRLRFIKRAKELGFTLNEVKELLSLRLDPATTCAEVKTRAAEKIKDIEARIHSLQRMKKALVKVTNDCSGQGPVDDCPILTALETKVRR